MCEPKVYKYNRTFRIGFNNYDFIQIMYKITVLCILWILYKFAENVFFCLTVTMHHKVVTWTEVSLLFSVPGGSDGPSGVLICSENYITYKNFGDQPDIRMPIPRRKVLRPVARIFCGRVHTQELGPNNYCWNDTQEESHNSGTAVEFYTTCHTAVHTNATAVTISTCS